jgi:hypothetical protein
MERGEKAVEAIQDLVRMVEDGRCRPLGLTA